MGWMKKGGWLRVERKRGKVGGCSGWRMDGKKRRDALEIDLVAGRT